MQLAGALLDVLGTILALLVVLTVLVAVHELGHHWFARLFGMKVDTFGVMMGGLRATDLRPKLKSPLAPAAYVWLAASVAFGLTLCGVGLNQAWLLYLGLGALAIPIPFWITLRLEKLYHLGPFEGVKTLLGSWAVFLVLMFMGGQFAAFGNLNMFFGMLLGGSSVGLMLVYYRPVAQKAEDSKLGEGRLEIDGEAQTVWFRPLISRKDRAGTEFNLYVLPLGGFAAIHGMHAKEDGSEVRVEAGFYSKPPWQRLIVLFAGPLFSILLGVLILFGLFAVAGQPKASLEVGQAIKGGPADQAGIKKGDRIVAVDGRAVGSFDEVRSDISNRVDRTAKPPQGLPVKVTVDRGGARLDFDVVTKPTSGPEPVLNSKGERTGEEAVQGRLGFEPGVRYEQMGPGEALQEAAMAPIRLVTAIGTMLRSFTTAREAIGGPVTVAQQSNRAVQRGLYTILELAAGLSISLGILNLLPIPPLDGGQMVVNFIEMLRGGKRLSWRLQNSLAYVGMAFVLLLTMGALIADVGRQTERAKTQSESSTR